MDRKHFRQKHKYALARASNLGAPLARFLRRFAVSSSTPPGAWRDLVLVGADHIGDVLCRTVGLDALKAALPNTRLHFIASRPAAELLETHPALDSVVISEKSSADRSISERVDLLKRRHLDAVFCYDTGDYWKEQLAVALARIPNCVGYTHKGFEGLVTKSLPFIFPRPYSESFLRSIESLIQSPISMDLRPVVHLTGEDEEAAIRTSKYCRTFGGMAMLAVGLTGNQPQGEALKERMMETLAALVAEVPVALIFLGAPGDRAEIEQRCSRWRVKGPILCGDLRLRECVAFLKRCGAAFVVDSGLRHMANAAGIPTVYFRNLFTFRGETGNYLPSEYDLAPDVECLSREVLAERPPLFEVSQGVEVLRKVLEPWRTT